jgi:hypothetical protein
MKTFLALSFLVSGAMCGCFSQYLERTRLGRKTCPMWFAAILSFACPFFGFMAVIYEAIVSRKR